MKSGRQRERRWKRWKGGRKAKVVEIEQASFRQRRKEKGKESKSGREFLMMKRKKGDNERKTRNKKEGQMPTTRTDCSP